MGCQPGDFAYDHFNLPPGFMWLAWWFADQWIVAFLHTDCLRGKHISMMIFARIHIYDSAERLYAPINLTSSIWQYIIATQPTLGFYDIHGIGLQNVFTLDFGLFQSSNTQLKGSQIPVTYAL